MKPYYDERNHVTVLWSSVDHRKGEDMRPTKHSPRKIHLSCSIMENDVPMGATAYCDTALSFPKRELTEDFKRVTCIRCQKARPPKCFYCGHVIK